MQVCKIKEIQLQSVWKHSGTETGIAAMTIPSHLNVTCPSKWISNYKFVLCAKRLLYFHSDLFENLPRHESGIKRSKSRNTQKSEWRSYFDVMVSPVVINLSYPAIGYCARLGTAAKGLLLWIQAKTQIQDTQTHRTQSGDHTSM